MECGAHPQLSWGQQGVEGGSHVFGKCPPHTLLVMQLKCRGGDQFTCTFLVSERMDPDNHLFSSVIVYLSLQLAS